jgi:hypothetical protein
MQETTAVKNVTEKLSKEEIRTMLGQAHTEIEKIEDETRDFSRQTKINTVFLVITFGVAFLYPLVYETFSKLNYAFFWISAFIVFAMRIKLFASAMLKSIALATLKEIVTVAEGDLEKLRREEYDRLTRQVSAKKHSRELQTDSGESN